MPHQFDILLFDAFSNHCLANLVEPLRAANGLSRRPLYRWRFLSLDGAPVRSSSQMQITPDGKLGSGAGETLVIMPSYGFRALLNASVLAPLSRAVSRYDRVAGLDTGAWLMAAIGLLEGRKATIHWQELESFGERFPQIDTLRERYVIDGNRITCSGAAATFDLAMDWIRQDQDSVLTLQIAELFMSEFLPSDGHPPPAPIRSPLVSRAVALMQEHLETPVSIGAIAKQAGCTQRKLESAIRAELDLTPQSLYQRLRLNLAFALVNDTNHSITEIATRTGYKDTSALTRAFKATFGHAPRALRRA